MAGERVHALQNGLLHAFPSEDALRELLVTMELRLPVISTARSLAVMVLDIIEYCEGRGRLDELVAWVEASRDADAPWERAWGKALANPGDAIRRSLAGDSTPAPRRIGRVRRDEQLRVSRRTA